MFNKEIKRIKTFIERYFTDSLQPILDFITKGCVLETHHSKESTTSNTRLVDSHVQPAKELSPKPKAHILTKEQIIERIKELEDETKLKKITEIIEM
jgi:hypothetical protein